MTSISHAKGPLAESIQRELQARIDEGRWQPGQRLGSERSLAMELGVSRSSLRQALGMMEQAGAVRRVIGRGGGTFVSHQKIDRDLSHIRSVPELLSAQGITAGTRILSTGTAPAAAATSEALELEPGQLVFAIVRIRLADGAVGLDELPRLRDLLSDQRHVPVGRSRQLRPPRVRLRGS